MLAIIAACNSDQHKNQGKTVFRYNEPNGITTLDPAYAKDQSIIWACNQLFNGLIQLNDSLKPVPCIAKSWTVNEDGTQYTFTLRNDVFFHDNVCFPGKKGRKVIASDFEFSFKRIVDPAVASPGNWIFNQVAQFDDKEFGFTAIDDTTFQVVLSKPFAPFINLLSMPYCSVVPHEAIKMYGKEFRNHPVGTGPFKFFIWKEGNSLVFHKNENYFEYEAGKRLPMVDAVQVSFLRDRLLAFLAFTQGKFDFNNSIDPTFKDYLLNNDGSLKAEWKGKFKFESSPYLNTEYLAFQMDSSAEITKGSPLLNLKVRQAINYAVDRVSMLKYLRNNIGTPGLGGMIPTGLPGYDTAIVKGYNYNPQKARALLADAGFPGGKGLGAITISTTSSYLDLCEYVANQLAEVGIKAKVEVNQSATHRELVSKQKLAFYRASWIADYPDAENYLSLFYSGSIGGSNTTHFKNDLFDQWYESSGFEPDINLRSKYYSKMDSLVMVQAPVLVLYYDQVTRLVSNKVEHLNNNAINLLNLKTVQIK